jgi:hypothetical protein
MIIGRGRGGAARVCFAERGLGLNAQEFGPFLTLLASRAPTRL